MEFAKSSQDFIMFYSEHFPSADEDVISLKAPEVLDLFFQINVFLLQQQFDLRYSRERHPHCLYREKVRPL